VIIEEVIIKLRIDLKNAQIYLNVERQKTENLTGQLTAYKEILGKLKKDIPCIKKYILWTAIKF